MVARGVILGTVVILAIIRVVGSTQPGEVTAKNYDKKPLQLARSYLQQKVYSWLPGDTGALAAGILVGGDDGLSYEAKNDFRRVGVTHVIAASGYNVIVVAGWVMAVGKQFWGRRLGIFFGIFCIVLYMFIAGLTTPVVRAGLMTIVGFVGLYHGRQVDAWWNLMVICLGMLIVRPEWGSEISWQLSVAATIAVLMVGAEMSKAKAGLGWGLVADLKTSTMAWALTMPLILHYFGQMSLIAPVANMLILWTIPISMQVAALALGIGMVWDRLGYLVAMLAWPGLKYVLVTASWLAEVPGAAMEVGSMSWGWVIVYYSTMMAYLVARRIQRVD